MGRALTLLDAPWRERSRSDSGHCTCGAAEAAAEAAAEPPTEPRAGLAEACPQPSARKARIDRRVSSASTTSRAARPAEYIVVLIDALTPSRLPLHLVIVSRIDLLLRKGQEART